MDSPKVIQKGKESSTARTRKGQSEAGESTLLDFEAYTELD